MKRNLTVIFISFMLITLVNTHLVFSLNNYRSEAETKPVFNNNQTLAEESREEQFKNLFITLFLSHVDKAISNYYDDYFKSPPTADPWAYKFVSIEKVHELNYSYVVVLEVLPYFGPHLSVGYDRITFKVGLDNVTVEKFEHLESHSLPPNYQDVIKKKWPPN